MARCRIVQPDGVRLHLSDGDFVDVKKELNAGEYFDLLMQMDASKAFAKVLAYLIGWSFLGADATPLPYSLDMDEKARRDTIRKLDKPTIRELVALVNKHEAAEERTYEAKKKTLVTSPASETTSISATP